MLAAAARRHLTAAGRRAKLRQDNAAAVTLLDRAVAFVPPTKLDIALEIVLGEALFDEGKGRDALQRAGSLAERASATGDRVGELCGRILEGSLRIHLEPEGATENARHPATQGAPSAPQPAATRDGCQGTSSPSPETPVACSSA